MRKVLGIAIGNLFLLGVLLGLVSLAERSPAATQLSPAVAPAPSGQHEPITSSTAQSAPGGVRVGEPAADSPVLDAGSVITGYVVSLDGKPVSGARVFASGGEAVTDNSGWFELPAGRLSQWVTVEHPNFLARTRAASPNTPLLVRLTPDDGETISIHFVGDTMFGRRFYDPNEDGDTSDGLLPRRAGVSEHLALLGYVQPLLENAHLTVINLESVLAADPYLDPTGQRPANFHPSKEYVFATHPSAAVALSLAGVDIIDIANNHVYDALEQGLVYTLLELEQAGFQPGAGYFGAGLGEAQAQQPAVVIERGQSIAFLGCTSITYPFIDGVPIKDEISYVASDAEDKGGAARCTEDYVRSAVAEAKSKYDVVVFMVHGGHEYERAPSDLVVRMSNAAREAGATLVINHQPHTVGGFDWNGTSLVAWTLGNFVFDQTVWETFESYLLAVHLRRGKVIHAYVEPLMIEGYVPTGITGALAEFVARGAAGREPGPFVVENGAMVVDVDGIATQHTLSVPLKGGGSPGSIFYLDDAWWVSGFSGRGSIRLGRDLLWVGSFEDEDVDAQRQEGTLWDLDDTNKSLGPAYAWQGDAGARIVRGARDSGAIVLTPLHRIRAKPGSELTIVGMVRTSASADLNLQLSWYPDTRGPSSGQTIEPIIVESDNAWEAFRVDASVPANVVAVGLFLRLEPPLTGTVTADFDNVRIVEWAPADSDFSPLYDHIQVVSTGQATLSKHLLPGIEFGIGSPSLERIWSPVGHKQSDGYSQ